MFARVAARSCSQLKRNHFSVLTSEALKFNAFKKPVIQVPVSLVSCVRDLHSHGSILKVQHPAPPFKGTAVVAGDFKEIDLCDFRGQYLVLFFYPLDFTFVCPTEIIAFSDRMNEFKEINTAVVGVSCDSHFSHLAWINTPRKHGGLGNLNYPLLSDFNKSIARDYSVLLEEDGVPLRGLFIIDPQGIVRQITVNDLPVGRSVDEVLRLVKAFQFTDKHGEVVCVKKGEEDKTQKDLKTKFSIPNIQPKSSTPKPQSVRFPVLDESEETRNLSIAQLERLVLLDQLKFYRLQMEELKSKKEEVKKKVSTTVDLLQERDCIAV